MSSPETPKVLTWAGIVVLAVVLFGGLGWQFSRDLQAAREVRAQLTDLRAVTDTLRQDRLAYHTAGMAYQHAANQRDHTMAAAMSALETACGPEWGWRLALDRRLRALEWPPK